MYPSATVPMPKFVVTVEFIRRSDVVVEADDAMDARSKVGNFEFDLNIETDLVGWRVTETKPHRAMGPALISEDSALTLARKRDKIDKSKL